VSTDQTDQFEPLLQAQVLALLEKRKRQGETLSGIRQGLSGWQEGFDLQALMNALSRRGEAIEWNQRWYSPRFIDFEIGTVRVLERGDALILSGYGGEPGFFVPKRHLKGAITRDLVLLRRSKKKPHNRGGGRLPEAVVVKVLSHRFDQLVGAVEQRGGSQWVVPFDSKLPFEVELDEEAVAQDGDYVVVELLEMKGKGGSPRGRVREVLGSIEEPGVDVEVVLRHFGIPDQFPSPVLEAALAFPDEPSPASFSGRRDLRQETVITIDGESARDFDDAISIEARPGGGYRLGIHIADVSAYVEEGSVLDREAYRRGPSVYYPDRAIPMLPETLSNGLCSLRPGVPRLTLSVFLDFDSAGHVSSRHFAETVIRSCRRMTYEQVRRILESDERPPPDLEPEVLELLQAAESLMKKRLKRREERGSIDFDLPEGDVVLDEEGFTVGVRPEQRSVAHRIIEEFMIAANEAVAEELSGHGWSTLHRIHSAPNPRDLEELREVLAEIGYELEGDLEALHPGVLQDLLARVEGKPEESFVSSMVLRSMQRALYHPESRGHYALSTRHYLHFTSPIRRYPDLLVHRQLKRLLADVEEEPGEPELLVRSLSIIAEHCSTTERRAEQSERVLLQWKLVRFLESRIGERFSGRITGVQPFGLFVQLTHYYVDGLVPLRSLTDDFYDFEAENHRLVGRRTGRKLRLADEIEVILDGVDQRRRGLNLRLDTAGKLLD
jgi:ribonuclease R